jgi:hypothetical protein
MQRKSGWTAWRYRNIPRYANPAPVELETIERDLVKLGVTIKDYAPSVGDFKKFKNEKWFPADYHGGLSGGVWDEKLLEHWISSERLALMDYSPKDIFVDVAAASSPWALSLRERKEISAYAIDLCIVGERYCHLPYYRVENATKTAFDKESVKGASLHCAYEMFMGEDDTQFIHEVGRILQPGGKVVILPLYTHTHYCAYSTPEYFGKGYCDAGAKEYVRMDCNGVPSSRKYNAAMLKQRVLDPIENEGMEYNLMALRNKKELGSNIYCHFILEITR